MLGRTVVVVLIFFVVGLLTSSNVQLWVGRCASQGPRLVWFRDAGARGCANGEQANRVIVLRMWQVWFLTQVLVLAPIEMYGDVTYLPEALQESRIFEGLLYRKSS